MTHTREEKLAKLKALMAKTTENGCTEAEALSALSRVQALMEQWEVSPEELREAREEGVEIRDGATVSGRSRKDRIQYAIISAVAGFCECKGWKQGLGRSEMRFRFCGMRGDIDFAEWLLETLTTFVDRECDKFLAVTAWGASASLRKEFADGFISGACERIVARLIELIEARRAVSTNSGALVVAKRAMIGAKLADAGLRFARGKSTLGGDADARAAGLGAGDRASFGRPVSGSAGVLRIGGKG